MQRLLLSVIAWIAFQSVLSAEEIGFQFFGTVVVSAPMFGLEPFPIGSSVSGRFVYDTISAPTHLPGDGDSRGYRQQIFNGFSMTVADVTFQADDYVVAIFNNSVSNHGADVFSVLYSSDLDPPLVKPMVVDGVPHFAGVLNVSFKNPPGTVFSDSSLPADLLPSNFPANGAAIQDVPTASANTTAAFLFGFSRLPAVVGDYDFDVDVDGDDFLLWQRTLGSMTELAADGNHSELIDEGDLVAWGSHFGDGADQFIAAPEPPTTNLLILAGLIVAAVVPRRACYGG